MYNASGNPGGTSSAFKLNNPSYFTVISVKGLANVKADSYVAIFALSQVGKTAEETTQIMDSRIQQIEQSMKQIANTQLFVDMISFVPMFDYEVEKKVFSKRTYNEVPIGFELRKNVHIRYTDATQIDKIVSILATQEVYDLVKVDYVSSKLGEIKAQMRAKAELLVKERTRFNDALEKGDTSINAKYVEDGFNVVYPSQRYTGYSAYSSSSVSGKRVGNVNYQDKKYTTYYAMLNGGDYDFVINPEIMEPVIQVEYEVKLGTDHHVKKQTDTPKESKETFILTPNGALQKLNL